MGIAEDLQAILDARYGRDVRQAIHDGIEEGYNIAVQAQGAAQSAQNSASAYADAALLSEQAAQDAQQAAEAAAEEAMSGTPEGYAALVAKVNSLSNETDQSFALINTAEGSALAHTVYGMSEQNGTPTPDVPIAINNSKSNFKITGKNLLVYPYYEGTKTSNGLKFTDNGDGTITINGTSTALTVYQIHLRQEGELNDFILKNGTYKLSGCPSDGGNSRYYLSCAVTKNGAGVNLGVDIGNAASITINGDDYSAESGNLYVYIQVASGVTCNNVIFKPMITLANAPNSDYAHFEPYKYKTIASNLVLRAIEVTSADPYNLVKDGKYYIADTVDWSEDAGYVFTHRIETINLVDVKSTCTRSATNDGENSKAFRFTVSNVGIVNGEAMSNRFKGNHGKAGNTSNLKTLGGLYATVTSGNDYFYGGFPSSVSSIEICQQWVTDNNVEIYVALTTPTAEPITSEQAQALLGLKTYDEATSIDCVENVAPVMDLEYSKDRNTALALTGHNMAYINDLRIGELENAAADA